MISEVTIIAVSTGLRCNLFEIASKWLAALFCIAAIPPSLTIEHRRTEKVQSLVAGHVFFVKRGRHGLKFDDFEQRPEHCLTHNAPLPNTQQTEFLTGC